VPNRYKVTLQDQRGEIVEPVYVVNWDPVKVPADEVAKLCAAEFTVKSGKTSDGKGYKRVFAGLSAQLLQEQAA
jgi:hypothetical protein